MEKWIKILVFRGLLAFFFFASSAFALPEVGTWMGSIGGGFAFGPTMPLISPQLEYVYRPNLYLGGLMQLGLGDPFLMTTSGSFRYLWDTELGYKLKPTVEGALGLALGSSSQNASVGVHMMFGFGVEYVYNRTTSLGSMFRLNFAPSFRSSFVTWPMIIGRFLL